MSTVDVQSPKSPQIDEESKTTVSQDSNDAKLLEAGQAPAQITYHQLPGIAMIDAVDERDFSTKKLQFYDSGAHITHATHHPLDPGTRSIGHLLPIRSDGRHYALKDEYVRDQRDGRLEYKRDDVIAKQRESVVDIFKQFGTSLLSGKLITNVSFPIGIFEPTSELQRAARVLGFAPYFLDKAATLTGDPLEQMKLVLTFVIARMHYMVEQKKPFNPIVGETYQGFVNGNPFFYEQVSHHPPISAFQYLGKGYTVEGCVEGVGSISVNTFSGGFVGIEKIICHQTGNTFYIKNPRVVLEGILYGKRLCYFDGGLRILDPQNNIYTRLKFNPDKTTIYNFFASRKYSYDAFIGKISEVSGSFSRACQALVTKDSKGKIKPKPEDMGRTFCDVTGAVFDRLIIGGKEYWHMNSHRPYLPVEVKNPLPSDATYRLDSLYMLNGDEPKAQKAKEMLETTQRKDKALRQAANKGGAAH